MPELSVHQTQIPGSTHGFLTRAEILGMVDSGDLIIDPFSISHLGTIHYRVHVGSLSNIGTSGRVIPLEEDRFQGAIGWLAPREYAVARLAERIVLPPGIVGLLHPASWLIENGFGFTGGKIDSGYGALEHETQPVIVGLQNLLDEPNGLLFREGIAHMSLVDVRGGPPETSGSFNPDQIRRFRERSTRFQYAQDDGPIYE